VAIVKEKMGAKAEAFTILTQNCLNVGLGEEKYQISLQIARLAFELKNWPAAKKFSQLAAGLKDDDHQAALYLARTLASEGQAK